MEEDKKENSEIDLFGEVDEALKASVQKSQGEEKKKQKEDIKKKYKENQIKQKEYAKKIYDLPANKEIRLNRAKQAQKQIEITKKNVRSEKNAQAKELRERTKELKEKALALLEGYKSSHYSKFKKHNIAIEDILGIMELLMFASKEDMYAFDITEAKYFFDDLGGFISKGDHHVINKKFSPSALMYQYFLYIENEENLDKYYSRKMNATEIAELQEKVLYELIRELHQQEYLIETQFIPKQKEKILRMLNIAKELYPSEIKKILNAYLDYLWDQEALTRIEVIDKNNILTLKLNILTDLVSNELNYYNRAEIIDNFMHGGLIIGFLGTFNSKTPKILDEFLTEKQDFGFGSRRITVRMRWDDKRTIKFGRRYSNRESANEYQERHYRLAHAWNNGEFGKFKVSIKKYCVIFKWKYPKFFKLDAIDSLKKDESFLVSDLLDLSEGNRYHELPRDLKIKEYEL